MYNRLYKHLNENEILYKKQFWISKKHSTENAILQLTNQMNNNFEKIK